MSRPPRKFSDLRSAPPAPRAASEDESPGSILRRVFCTTQDGIKARAILAALAAAPLPPLSSNRALREAEGARSFLAKIDDMIKGSDARSS